MKHARLLRLNELSDRTGLPPAWLQRECDAGRIPHLRIGRSRMFDVAAVLAYIERRRTSSKHSGSRTRARRNAIAEGQATTRARARGRRVSMPEQGAGGEEV